MNELEEQLLRVMQRPHLWPAFGLLLTLKGTEGILLYAYGSYSFHPIIGEAAYASPEQSSDYSRDMLELLIAEGWRPVIKSPLPKTKSS